MYWKTVHKGFFIVLSERSGSMKTGVNTGTIIHVEDSPIMKRAYEKSDLRQKRAKICIECLNNEEGYCKKHNGWCGRVNYICLGIKDPYEYKVPKSLRKSKKYKKIQKKSKQLSAKQIDNLAKRYKMY